MTGPKSSANSDLRKLMHVGLISIAVIPFALISSQSAFAVSGAVKNACKGDYLSYCSNHAVGSKGLRRCMRAAGSKLSKGCVNALVSAGEVSKSDLARFAKRSR